MYFPSGKVDVERSDLYYNIIGNRLRRPVTTNRWRTIIVNAKQLVI